MMMDGAKQKTICSPRESKLPNSMTPDLVLAIGHPIRYRAILLTCSLSVSLRDVPLNRS